MTNEITCNESQQLIPWLLDDELDPTQSLMVENHIDVCGDCRAFLEHEAQLRLVVRRAAGDVIAPKSLRSFVRQELDADLAQKNRSSSMGRFWPAAAAAAVLLTFISNGDVGVSNGDWEKLMGRHQRNLPMDVQAADHSQVQRYFSGRLPFSVQLPRFQKEMKPPIRDTADMDARLLGGRVTQFDNRDAAYVRYRLPRGNLSVFVYEDRGAAMPETGVFLRAGNHRVLMQRYRGYSIARWKNRGLVYSIISDLPEPEFRTVVLKRMAH